MTDSIDEAIARAMFCQTHDESGIMQQSQRDSRALLGLAFQTGTTFCGLFRPTYAS